MSLGLRAPSLGKVLASVSLLGLVVVSVAGGAAIMHFNFVGADFLRKGFTAAQILHQQYEAGATAAAQLTAPEVTLDLPDKTCAGFTLYTTTNGTRATLIDMRGNVVHHWELPFSKAWPHLDHLSGPTPDQDCHWFRTHLFPNGDLLVVYHAWSTTPKGRALVKLDKDSRLLWAYSACAHHDIDVGEDGTIYCLTEAFVKDLPRGFPGAETPWLAENLVLLSPEGKELRSIPIAEALHHSPYALMLHQSSCDRLPAGLSPERTHVQTSNLDHELLHTNSVRLLSKGRAARFPLFKPGQVLLSLRSLSCIAVLDPGDRSVTWAARGMWRSQHDADFLDNGHVLFYDNLGGLSGSRVLEYDPVRQGIAWSHADKGATSFTAVYRGTVQRLPNGNTLITDPDHGRVFEVTPSNETVWDCLCPLAPTVAGKGGYIPAHALTSARRYGAQELRFLPTSVRARP